MNFNHKRPLSDFYPKIDLIREAGFKPIAVTQMYLEDTFVFETKEEALNAYNTLEIEPPHVVSGWWYEKNDFLNEVKNYENKMPDTKILIYWL